MFNNTVKKRRIARLEKQIAFLKGLDNRLFWNNFFIALSVVGLIISFIYAMFIHSASWFIISVIVGLFLCATIFGQPLFVFTLILSLIASILLESAVDLTMTEEAKHSKPKKSRREVIENAIFKREVKLKILKHEITSKQI